MCSVDRYCADSSSLFRSVSTSSNTRYRSSSERSGAASDERCVRLRLRCASSGVSGGGRGGAEEEEEAAEEAGR